CLLVRMDPACGFKAHFPEMEIYCIHAHEIPLKNACVGFLQTSISVLPRDLRSHTFSGPEWPLLLSYDAADCWQSVKAELACKGNRQNLLAIPAAKRHILHMFIKPMHIRLNLDIQIWRFSCRP
ncbi:MAG: hypothetical protein AAFN43_09630, partial [Pseudomonadota bacterium]